MCMWRRTRQRKEGVPCHSRPIAPPIPFPVNIMNMFEATYLRADSALASLASLRPLRADSALSPLAALSTLAALRPLGTLWPSVGNAVPLPIVRVRQERGLVRSHHAVAPVVATVVRKRHVRRPRVDVKDRRSDGGVGISIDVDVVHGLRGNHVDKMDRCRVFVRTVESQPASAVEKSLVSKRARGRRRRRVLERRRSQLEGGVDGTNGA